MTLPRLLLLCVTILTRLGATQHGLPPLDLRAFAAAEIPGGLAPGAIVPNFRLTDHRGFTRELYYESTAKAVVLVFTATGSARALQTASALRALRARFPAGDVVIWQIDSNAGANRIVIAAEQTLFNNDTPVLLDPAQIVAAELDATHQLETFVIAPPPFSRLVYRGPLDNANPASLDAPSESYASDAVAALLAGREPVTPRMELHSTSLPLDLLPSPSINYATDVAPIVVRRCTSCHSTGNIAPHVYGRFEDLSSRATQIRATMLLKRMSPWHADEQYGVFSNSGLTPGETATLHAWAHAGAPRGNGADPLVMVPPPPGGDWPLGQPDLILTIPTQTLPTRGPIEYRYLSVPVPLSSERWLRAAVVKPGNPRVVHHALVFVGTLLDVLLNEGGLGGFFAGYVPGLQQTFFPDSTGKRIRQNSEVTFQMHYTATGQAETDASQIGFYFT